MFSATGDSFLKRKLLLSNRIKKFFPSICRQSSVFYCLLAAGSLTVPTRTLAEVVFDNQDEAGSVDGFEDASITEAVEMPEIEAEQDDLRQDRKNGLGFSVGEVFPYTTIALEYHRNLSATTAVFFVFGRGALNSNLQAEGEDLALNKVTTSAYEVGYIKWVSQAFPLALSGFVNIVRADGSLVSTEASRGRHRIDSIGLGSDIRVQTLFENGFWLKWSLLSLRYLRPIAESHSNFPTAQLSTSRGRFAGLKILGVTNVTIGYAW